MKSFLTFASGGSAAHAWMALLLIRVLVGWIFILAGIRKFMEPATMGAGRFAELGMPYPELLGPWVGFWEITGGLMVLFGLFTRAGAIPLIVVMTVAIWTTKVQPFQTDGIVAGLHAMRLDSALLLSSLYLVLAGSGRFALDALVRKRFRELEEIRRIQIGDTQKFSFSR